MKIIEKTYLHFKERSEELMNKRIRMLKENNDDEYEHLIEKHIDEYREVIQKKTESTLF